MNGVYPLSFSRISTFEQCPLRFDYQYVTASHKDAGSDASRFGNAVHEAFEAYLKTGDSLPDNLLVFMPLLDSLRTREKDRLLVEHEMAVTRDRKPCAWDSPDCWIRGIADFVVLKGTTAVAGDWKTGKPKDNTDQLKLMAALLFEHFPDVLTVNTSYFWLYHRAPPQVITYTRDMLPDLWKFWEAKDTAIVETANIGVFPPRPSGLCPWCPAYNTCAYARRRK